MKFLIQRGFYSSERNYRMLDEILSKYNIDFETISIAPYIGEIYYHEEDIDGNTVFNRKYDFDNESNVIIFGSVKLAQVAATLNTKLYPCSFFNDNHDYMVYSKYYKENMLNHDSTIINLSDELPNNTPSLFFARPTKDSKLWTGSVFMEHSYYELRDTLLKNNETILENGQTFKRIAHIEEQQIQISPIKEIVSETRCFIIKGGVVTMSEYRRGNQTIYRNVDNDLELKSKVQSLVDIYQPSEGFVMDVCELEDGSLKIVEINCLNCSGFYDIDMSKLIQGLVVNFSK
jgi:hypothetical protein